MLRFVCRSVHGVAATRVLFRRPLPLAFTRHFSLRRVLTPKEKLLFKDEKQLLSELFAVLTRIDASSDDLQLIHQAESQVEDAFLLVVVGEFNSGKSSFINALLGEKHLKEGVLPTTSRVHIIRHTDSVAQEDSVPAAPSENYLNLFLPIDWLSDIHLVDTPGTNAIMRSHQKITESFVPRADIILFITSVDRPFSESEKQFLERIRGWGKKVVMVVNKSDLLESAADCEQVREFVAQNASAQLGINTKVFMISTKEAFQAKHNHRQQHLSEASLYSPSTSSSSSSTVATARNVTSDSTPIPSQPTAISTRTFLNEFEELEMFIFTTLDSDERLRLKLENPLGLVESLLSRYRRQVTNAQQLLEDDFQTLASIDEELMQFRTELWREYENQLVVIDNILLELTLRGEQFFDKTLRLGSVLQVLGKSNKIQTDFEELVVAETTQKVNDYITDMIEWTVERSRLVGKNVIKTVHRRLQNSEHKSQPDIAGDLYLSTELHRTRNQLLLTVGRSAKDIVSSFDAHKEAELVRSDIKQAIVQSLGLQVTAVGLGAALTAALMDVSGLVGGGLLVASSMFILPHKRRQITIDFKFRVSSLRDRLKNELTKQLRKELDRTVGLMRHSYSPYSRFVSDERRKLDSIVSSMAHLEKKLRTTRQRLRESVAPSAALASAASKFEETQTTVTTP